MKSKRLRAFDRKWLRGSSCAGLIGIDEAGRGALAGPVVAAAVAARSDFYESEWCRRRASDINDSKLISPERRAELYRKLVWLEQSRRIVIGLGTASVDEIDAVNILGATQIAMRRAVEEALGKSDIVPHEPDPLFHAVEEGRLSRETIGDWTLLVDGTPMRSLGYPHSAVVKGDSKSLCIAMASIVAKVRRDALMEILDTKHPGYGFAECKGYGTPPHRAAIQEKGPCSAHRPLFLRNLLALDGDAGQTEFGF